MEDSRKDMCDLENVTTLLKMIVCWDFSSSCKLDLTNGHIYAKTLRHGS